MSIKSRGVLVQADVATLANVAASATVVTLQAQNTERGGLIIHNDSASNCYVKFGATATTTSYTYKMGPGDHLVLSAEAALYTGIVTGIWDSATGSARMTELS